MNRTTLLFSLHEARLRTLSIDSIVLVEEAQTLAAVTIVSRKPLLEQRIDRLVINVASGVTTAGNTILEVLERSPGVIVNRQDNTIAMNGKDGVNIMINGKLNYMPVSADGTNAFGNEL